jgi:uncharacterized protein
VTSAQHDCHQVLSQALNREVTLAATARAQVAGVPSSVSAAGTAHAEEYWPDIDGLDYRDTITEFALPPGTFFDCATVHLLTTATLNRLRDGYPHGRFEVQRFRPTSWWTLWGVSRALLKMPGSGTRWPSGTRCASTSRGPAVAV